MHVDDNPDDSVLLRTALSEIGSKMQFHGVTSVVHAIQFLQRRGDYANAPTPSAIILDLNMPVMNGIALLNIIKESRAWSSIPVTVLSSSQAPRDRYEALAAGADNYLVKPTNWEEYVRLARSLSVML